MTALNIFKKTIVVSVLFILLIPLQVFAYTLDDYSDLGGGNIHGFNSDYFSLTNSDIETQTNGGTSTGSTELTFTNTSSTNFSSLLVTYDGMSPHTVIDQGDLIETSLGSGVYLNYVNFGQVNAGEQFTTSLSLTAMGNSAFGQVTSAKINTYDGSGPSGAAPEPSTYLLVILTLIFSTKLILANRNENIFYK